MTELYTPRAAAERLGISYPTIKQWLYRGKLRGIKTPGGHYRIPARELDLLLKDDGPSAPKKKSLSASVSGRNQLQGTVSEVRFNGLLAQVKLAIGSQSVTAIITAEAARELQLKPGVRAAALIKSTEVMVVRV
jgi:molybdopterin-binding protein